MFGHQNDIITRDQKQDAAVTLPESALQALTTAPPASGSITDSPIEQTSASSDQPVTAPSAPALAATSIDGFSAPNARLSSPFAYMQSSVSDFSKPTDTTVDTTSSTANDVSVDDAQVPDPIQLGTVSDDTTAPQGPVTEEETQVATEPAAIPFPEETLTEAPHAGEEPLLAETPAEIPEDLERIRAAALSELTPLVGQLELSPEEKFHTIMSLIHSTDNHTLISDAYEAAKGIKDPKDRAESLLAVINEIDYFSNASNQPSA